MKCPHCGIHYLDDARECPICGKRSPIFGQKKDAAHRRKERSNVPSATCARRDSSDPEGDAYRDTELDPASRPRDAAARDKAKRSQPAAQPLPEGEAETRRAWEKRRSRKVLGVVSVSIVLLGILPTLIGFGADLVDGMMWSGRESVSAIPQTESSADEPAGADQTIPPVDEGQAAAAESAAAPLFNAYYTAPSTNLELGLLADDYAYTLYLDGYEEVGELYWWYDDAVDNYPEWASPDVYQRFVMSLGRSEVTYDGVGQDALRDPADEYYLYVYIPRTDETPSELLIAPAFEDEVPPWMQGEDVVTLLPRESSGVQALPQEA